MEEKVIPLSDFPCRSYIKIGFFMVCWVDELPITQEKYLSLYRFLIRRWRDVCVCAVFYSKKTKNLK